MRMKILLLIGLLISIAGFSQQMRTISGKVTDAKDGSPLAGVTIKGKGQTKVVLSQQDGSFTITLPDNVKEIEFSFVGFGDL